MNKLNHIAFIMDGNGRWGVKKGKGRNFGHLKGVETVKKIVEISIKLKIPFLTFYVFSSENWKRPKQEINYLFNLLESFLTSKIAEFHKQNIKLKVIGKKNFSKKLNLLLNSAEKKTSKNSKIQINLALNYGSKFELLNAIKKIVKNNLNINEKNIEKFLYTKNIPNPDLLIRTGNTKRLSNFLLWQLAYSEIFFEKKLWPDFNEKDYSRIINKFRKVKRNYGNI